ncbi:MAG: 3-isopropylmalate dehydrogenase [Oscillospiraceae bacterium]|jgi:3-isopropylmalate dehydrogenase|nr:3-isopropylmalate dehydrogenase [Oscillospiraceae bacterium]
MKARIALLPGDGIGPEICAQAVRVLETAAALGGHVFHLDSYPIGGASIDAHGEPLTKGTLGACQQADAVLLAAVGGPKWDDVDAAIRPERGLLALRKGLGVYANLRPCTIHPALTGACPLRPDLLTTPIDILMVRELTGDVYFGAHEQAADGESASDQMIYTAPEVRRVAQVAFRLAQGRGKRLCSVDKANVLAASRLWRRVVTDLAQEFPDVALTHMYVDNAAMQLVLRPSQFDVVVTGNLFGDILSDESAAIAGSLGMMPSASLGDGKQGLYEPIHGSAPDIAGQNLANPLGTILSVALLLRHSLGLADEAAAVERAVSHALDAGFRTGDIYSAGYRRVTCTGMGDAVIEALKGGA